MADKPRGKSARRQPYHHGDLRRDLLRVAREQIALHGAQAVSMTSLAQLVGVSQPALYRHFADREALLEAVAAQAFEEFTSTLGDALRRASPTDARRDIALAYVAFGEAHREVYRLMFASRLTPEAKASSDLNRASAQAFDLLLRVLSNGAPASAVRDDAYLFWAQLHGLVMLKADGFLIRPLARFVERRDAAESPPFTSAPRVRKRKAARPAS